MIKKIKLKHLDLLMQEKIDYAFFMKEFGYKNRFFKRKSYFKKAAQETYDFIELVKGIEPKRIGLNPDCDIKYPENIDSISFEAMMTVISYMNSSENRSIAESMGMVIAIICYSENCKGDFNMSGFRFKSFKARVLGSLAFDMIGLFNHLDKKLVESSEFWEKRFLEVEVSDEDYTNAGGGRMNSFNVVNTIKGICKDFNYTEKEAWKVPYALTQTNSLAKATQAHVQDIMRKIKEDRMKSKRKNSP